jgi:outer membrane immunogenic protein
MRKFIRVKVLLAGACIVTGLTAQGQRAQSAERQTSGSLDVAVVYNPLLANVVSGNRFWMQGGSVQGHGQFWHGLSVVGDVSGLHTASTGGSSGVGLDMVTATFGPRYTWSSAHRRYAVFGQALVGEAHGMNSVFPNPAGANESANSLALYVGGGVNLRLKDHLALRAFEADWLRTQLPNATTNVQNNFRVGAGLIYRFK